MKRMLDPSTVESHTSGSGLNVLQVVAAFPPYYSGTGTVALHNSMELVKAGHRVRVVTPHLGRQSVEFLDGIEVHRLPARLRIGLASFLSGVDNIAEFDVLHVHAPFPIGGDQVFRAVRHRGKPLVVTYHQDLIQKGLIGVAFSVYTQLVLRPLLREARAIIVPTLDYARESSVSRELMAADRLVEIPNGVDVSRFFPGPPQEPLPIPWTEDQLRRAFLFVGGLDRAHYFKGVDVLIRALARMKSREAHIVIVGEGGLRARYEALAHRLWVHHRVHFAGRVSPARLPDYYRATGCTVLPSTTMGEIFGIVLLEAMACGRPTIATALPGVRTVVDHERTGLLVPPCDVEAFSQAMDHILSSPNVMEMGRRGREKAVAKYDWSEIGKSLSKLYEEVVA